MEAVEVTLKYNNVDISKGIADYLVSLEFSDNIEGESDMITLEFDNTHGEWSGDWYPQKGATIEAGITTETGTIICGLFEIDEVKIQGPPDLCVIRGMAAGVTKKFRLERSKGYENQTLADLAQRIATSYGMRLVGEIKPIKIGRITQHRARDLSFLRNIAIEHGYLFSIRNAGRDLVFFSSDDLEKMPADIAIYKQDCIDYTFSDIVIDTYQSANVIYKNSATNEVIKGTAQAAPASIAAAPVMLTPAPIDVRLVEGVPATLESIGIAPGLFFGETDTGVDSLELKTYSEDESRATEIAQAQLKRKNSMKMTAEIKLNAAYWAVAGKNAYISGFGTKVDGKYHFIKTTHRVDNAGYLVEVEAKQV